MYVRSLKISYNNSKHKRWITVTFLSNVWTTKQYRRSCKVSGRWLILRNFWQKALTVLRFSVIEVWKYAIGVYQDLPSNKHIYEFYEHVLKLDTEYVSQDLANL